VRSRIAALGVLISLALAAACGGISQRVEVPPESTPDPDQLRALFEIPVDRSAPPAAQVLQRFALIGDWGEGTPAQARIAGIMCQVRAARPFTYVLTTGDNFYGPDGRATDRNYYGPEYCIYSYPGHQWRPAWGNHDTEGDATHSVLGAPASPRYYTWTAGDIAFFVYDGNLVDTRQQRWLRDAVCGSRAKVKIIYGHQPVYSPGPHGSDGSVRSMVQPVARDCGVSLVLSGHDHLYSRSKPVDGVTYVVSGGGGGVLYDCESVPSWLQLCASKAHFLLIEETESSIKVTAIALDGSAIDSFEIPLGP
jgi:hypothetical protein